MLEMDLGAFIKLEQSKKSIVDKLNYLKDHGLNEYLLHACEVLGIKKLSKKSANQIIQQILSKTPNEFIKKVKSEEYYKAHLSALKLVMEEMFLHDELIKNIEDHQEEAEIDIVIYNYYHLLSELLYDMALLLQEYQLEIKKALSGKLKLFKNPFQNNFTLYQTLPQTIFGQVSFHSYIEREPCVSIALIRQIIELKIRNSFGVLGVFDNVKNSYEPLSMGQIFDEIKKHQRSIDFAIPLENIIRINGWANIFMHSGLKDYTWTLIFVYRYIHEFIKGREGKLGYAMNNGIKLTKNTLDDIQNGLKQTAQSRNPNLEIHTVKADVCIIK